MCQLETLSDRKYFKSIFYDKWYLLLVSVSSWNSEGQTIKNIQETMENCTMDWCLIF